MKFGLINNYLLFGGGDLLLKIALYLKSQNYGFNKWVLNYNAGTLSARPIGNYKSQHWDTSEINLAKNNFYTYDPSKTSHSKFGSLQEVGMSDPNKIKINLNLKDKNIASLLAGLKASSGANDNSTQEPSTDNDGEKVCDKFIHKNALSSLCPGCNLPNTE